MPKQDLGFLRKAVENPAAKLIPDQDSDELRIGEHSNGDKATLWNKATLWFSRPSPEDRMSNRIAITRFLEMVGGLGGHQVADAVTNRLSPLYQSGKPLTTDMVRQVLADHQLLDEKGCRARNLNSIALFASGSGGAADDIGWMDGYGDLWAAQAKGAAIPDDLTNPKAFHDALEHHLKEVTKGEAGDRLLTRADLENHAKSWIVDLYPKISAATFDALTPKLKASLDPLGQKAFDTVKWQIKSAIEQKAKQQGSALDRDAISAIATAKVNDARGEVKDTRNKNLVEHFLYGYREGRLDGYEAGNKKSHQPFLDLLNGDVDPNDPVYGKLAMPNARYAYPRLSLAERETARTLIERAAAASGKEQDTLLGPEDVLAIAKDVLTKLIGARAELAAAVPALAQRFPIDEPGGTQNAELFDRVRARLAESVFDEAVGPDKAEKSRFVGYLARGTDVIAEDRARKASVNTTYRTQLTGILGTGGREEARVDEWATVMEALRWVEQRTLGRLSLGAAKAAEGERADPAEDGQKHLDALRALASPSASGIDWENNKVLQAVQSQIETMMEDPERTGAPIDLATIEPATIAIRTYEPPSADGGAIAPADDARGLAQEDSEIIEYRNEIERRKALPDYPTLAEHNFGQVESRNSVVEDRHPRGTYFDQDDALRRARQYRQDIGRAAFKGLSEHLMDASNAMLSSSEIGTLLEAPEQLNALRADDAGAIGPARTTIRGLQTLHARLTDGSVHDSPLMRSLLKDVNDMIGALDRALNPVTAARRPPRKHVTFNT